MDPFQSRCPVCCGLASFSSDRMRYMEKKRGKIIIPAGVNVWPHELDTAKALAAAGYVVEFAERHEGQYEKSADLIIAGRLWEMKAPKSDKPAAVDKNLRKALHQAPCVVFDSRRMKGLPDSTIERELRKSAVALKSMKRLLFVNCHGSVVDIK